MAHPFFPVGQCTQLIAGFVERLRLGVRSATGQLTLEQVQGDGEGRDPAVPFGKNGPFTLCLSI